MYLNLCANPFLKPPQDIVEQTTILKKIWFIIIAMGIEILNFVMDWFLLKAMIFNREKIYWEQILFLEKITIHGLNFSLVLRGNVFS